MTKSTDSQASASIHGAPLLKGPEKMTREQLIKIWEDAKYIFTQSRLPDVRRKAKAIAVAAEVAAGPIGNHPADAWEV